MPSPESFSEKLKTYRRTMGWTQEELAKKWNYSFETISAWERGKRNPRDQQIPRIAHLLGMAPGALIQSIDMVRDGLHKDRNQESVTHELIKEWKGAFETWGELENIYHNRSEFNSDFSYPRIFEDAHDILAIGISLNAIAMNYSREKIMYSIMRNKSTYNLCFLDPKGVYCNIRENEEGYPKGSLGELTQLNIRNVEIIQNQLHKIDPNYSQQLKLMLYDLPPRYSIYVIDDMIMTMQCYAYERGEDTPIFVLRRQSSNGLFEFYASIAKHILAKSTLHKHVEK